MTYVAVLVGFFVCGFFAGVIVITMFRGSD